MPITEDAFQSIEMKEKMAAQNRIHKSSTGSKNKRSVLKDSNENLPYTEFEGFVCYFSKNIIISFHFIFHIFTG